MQGNWKREKPAVSWKWKKNNSEEKNNRKQIWSPHRYQKAESLCFMSRVANQTKKSRRQFWLQSPISYLSKSAFQSVLTRRLETVSYLLPSFKRHFPWYPKLVTIQNGSREKKKVSVPLRFHGIWSLLAVGNKREEKKISTAVQVPLLSINSGHLHCDQH